jgi:predicted RND superfamily exporter protein
MELPNELVVLISAGVGFLVTNGLKALFPAWDISGVSAKITAALVTCVVALGNQALAFVPAEYQQVVVTLFALIISILGAYGIHFTLKAPKG